MGGKGSGRRQKDKELEKITDFKPAKEEPEKRFDSMPAHVSKFKTSSGCRFEG